MIFDRISEWMLATLIQGNDKKKPISFEERETTVDSRYLDLAYLE